MSRRSHAAPSTPGRHRLERAGGVRVTDLPAVRSRLAPPARADRRSALLRWLVPTASAGRHTWDFLAGNGGRPRTAFAIILSL